MSEPRSLASSARLLMTADAQGGVWTYALELSAALGRRGIEVVLATMGAPLDHHQRAEVDRLGLAVHESDERLEWMPSAWEDVDRAGEWLLALAEEVEPDIVHLNGYCHAALPWGRPVVVVAHSSAWTWWRAVHGGDPPDEWSEYRRRVIQGLGAADRVVAVSRAMLADLEEVYCPLPQAAVIPSGRDPAAMRPGRKQPFIFSAGRLWDEAKNLVALDRAAPEVPWPIHVAGEAHHPDGRPVRPRHLSVLGRLPAHELAEWMERAAIFAAPARYEPFGLAALEAGLAGCALVLGDIPSLRELWGDAAVFVPPDDPHALGEALRQLVADSAERGRRARAARMRALTYGPDRMASAYLSLYSEVAVDGADTGSFRAIREIAASSMISSRRLAIAEMPWIGGAQASLRFGIASDDELPARPAARDFPTVEAVDRLEPCDQTVAVDSGAWRDGDADFYWIDAQADALGERGLVPVATAGEPLIRLELLTRCQRWLDRRNLYSAVPWFDQLLAFHRSLHDRQKPHDRAAHNRALDAWQWVLRLDPVASAALQVAALFGADGEGRVSELLSGAPAPRSVAERACTLVRAIADPPDLDDGDGEVSVLEDAGCLSFFGFASCGFLDDNGEPETRRRIAATLQRLSLRACAYLPAVRLRRDVARLFSEAASPE